MGNHDVLLVEDEMVVGLEIQKTLERLGYNVPDSFTRAENAIDFLQSREVDLVLMDVKLEGKLDGIEATKLIHDTSEVPVVFITSFSNESVLKRIRGTEASGYVLKPIHTGDLDNVISHTLGLLDEEPDLTNGGVFFRELDEYLKVLVGLQRAYRPAR